MIQEGGQTNRRKASSVALLDTPHLQLNSLVPPSSQKTIYKAMDGTHSGFAIENAQRIERGVPVFQESFQYIKFAEVEDGEVVNAGITEGQLVAVLIERVSQMEDAGADKLTRIKLTGLHMFMDALKQQHKDK